MRQLWLEMVSKVWGSRRRKSIRRCSSIFTLKKAWRSSICQNSLRRWQIAATSTASGTRLGDLQLQIGSIGGLSEMHKSYREAKWEESGPESIYNRRIWQDDVAAVGTPAKKFTLHRAAWGHGAVEVVDCDGTARGGIYTQGRESGDGCWRGLDGRFQMQRPYDVRTLKWISNALNWIVVEKGVTLVFKLRRFGVWNRWKREEKVQP
jgi:hypothetical protein